MQNGYLSQYFQSVVAKVLRTVEVYGTKSNQHEFNGTKELKNVLFETERVDFGCRLLWMNDENDPITADTVVTWYDAREASPDRSEYRLYCPDNVVMKNAHVGDVMFLARKTDNTLLIIISPSDSSVVSQLYWLFNLTPPQGNLFSFSELNIKDKAIDFSARFIMEAIGIELKESEHERLDELIAKYNGEFPSVTEFSELARRSLPVKIDVIEDPDNALIELMTWEEMLFRRLEKHKIAARLREGFFNGDEPDVEAFIGFSLSVLNRRKARAGSAFEEHVQYILKQQGISYSKGQITEDKAKPDFLFPHVKLYHNPLVPAELLTMLGVKTSLKDRWRQVLAEAARISAKHLLTMQPGISDHQLNQMKAHQVQLVLPKGIHKTYNPKQHEWLMSFHEFIGMVREKQQLIASGFEIPDFQMS